MTDNHAGHAHLPDLSCPYCGELLDCATGAYADQSAVPTDGAVSLCVFCAQPAMFVVSVFGTAVRRATPEEKASILEQHGEYIGQLIAVNQLAKSLGDC